MTKRQKQRLQKLANHLRHGELGHEVFDFRYFNVDKLQEHVEDGCGYAGCAIGECPFVFPRPWHFEGPSVCLKTVDPLDWEAEILSAMEFFGLTKDEVYHLFHPYRQDPEHFGGQELGKYATKEEVADNIEAFLTTKDQP